MNFNVLPVNIYTYISPIFMATLFSSQRRIFHTKYYISYHYTLIKLKKWFAVLKEIIIKKNKVAQIVNDFKRMPIYEAINKPNNFFCKASEFLENAANNYEITIIIHFKIWNLDFRI